MLFKMQSQTSLHKKQKSKRNVIMKRYCYFISFSFSSDEGPGFGNAEVFTKTKITNIKQIVAIGDNLKSMDFKSSPEGFSSCLRVYRLTVIQYSLLRVEKCT